MYWLNITIECKYSKNMWKPSMICMQKSEMTIFMSKNLPLPNYFTTFAHYNKKPNKS